MSTAELAYPVNRTTVEHVHRTMKRWQEAKDYGKHAQGVRAAKARDTKLLHALEKGLEVMDGLVEEQLGRTRRDWGTPFAKRAYPTDAGLWKAAYEAVENNGDLEPWGWVYAAAGLLAGVVS